jgi:predicted transcriptional regulator
MRTFSEAGRVLGELELRLMEIVWARRSPATVRAVLDALPEPQPAYTTVMTTLDRLHRKGLLDRQRVGLAFEYVAAMSRDAYHGRIVEAALSTLIQSSAGPVLAAFVDAAAAADARNLDRLSALIDARRAAEARQGPAAGSPDDAEGAP